jgi:hypothetical protein
VLEIRNMGLPVHFCLFAVTAFLPELFACRHYAPMIPYCDAKLSLGTVQLQE